MSTNSQLSDFVTRIKIAQHRKDVAVIIRLSKLTFLLATLFYRSGFIKSFYVVNGKDLLLALKYHNQLPLIRQLKVVSSPGHRVYWNLVDLSRALNRASPSTFYILSTPKGLCTSADCLLGRRRLVAGEVFLYVQLTG